MDNHKQIIIALSEKLVIAAKAADFNQQNHLREINSLALKIVETVCCAHSPFRKPVEISKEEFMADPHKYVSLGRPVQVIDSISFAPLDCMEMHGDSCYVCSI